MLPALLPAGLQVCADHMQLTQIIADVVWTRQQAGDLKDRFDAVHRLLKSHPVSTELSREGEQQMEDQVNGCWTCGTVFVLLPKCPTCGSPHRLLMQGYASLSQHATSLLQCSTQAMPDMVRAYMNLIPMARWLPVVKDMVDWLKIVRDAPSLLAGDCSGRNTEAAATWTVTPWIRGSGGTMVFTAQGQQPAEQERDKWGSERPWWYDRGKLTRVRRDPGLIISGPICNTCGRPNLVSAKAVMRSRGYCCAVLCTKVKMDSDLTSATVLARSRTWIPGHGYQVAVPIGAIRWGESCYAPEYAPLLRTPPWIAALAERDQPEPSVDIRQGLRIFSYNPGGLADRAVWLTHTMVALDVDVVMVQEVWAPGQIKQLLAGMYRVMVSETMDQGTGFMIAWRRDLPAEKTESKVVYDAQDFYAVKTHWTGIGTVLLVSVHIPPSWDYKQQKESLERQTTLAQLVKAALEVMAGDFNMSQESARRPLKAALNTGCYHGYTSVLPTGVLTNFTVQEGLHRATSIDHMFVRKQARVVSSDVLPTTTSHVAILAEVVPASTTAELRNWKFLKWRRATPEQIGDLAMALDYVWGQMAYMGLPPNAYIRVFWKIAKQFIPTPVPPADVAAYLKSLGHKYTGEKYEQMKEYMAEAAKKRGYEDVLGALQALTLTSTVSRALMPRGAPPRPYEGIVPQLGVSLPTPDRRRQEVHNQAKWNTRKRHMNMDHEYLSLKYKDESQQRFEPALHLPLPVLGRLMASGSGQVTVEEAHKLLAESSTNLLDPRDFYPVVTRRGTHFVVLDQVS